ncbi:MAG: carboxymuconolactone decarboxylase family protein [Gemmatimonadaceae bacterium]
MTTGAEVAANVAALEMGIRHLVRIAGAIAGSPEGQVRSLMSEALDGVDPVAVEEIILQSYLFAGFPRTLNAMRIWRSVSKRPAPPRERAEAASDLDTWRERGEETCEVVYGKSYEKLRKNVVELHPVLEDWMIVDGYGKVLARPGVDLQTRELCVVAACAVSGQQRQLHSHLYGALNAGAPVGEVRAVLEALSDLITREDLVRYKQLLQKVQAH